MIDLCYQLADYGDKFYCEAAERMIATMPYGAARFIQFSNKGTEAVYGANRIVHDDIPPEKMIFKRVEILRNFARTASHNIVMTDCDMLWKKSPEPVFEEDFDVGLCWRTGNPAMPYYGGFVFVRHGSEAAQHFLTEWHFTMATQPPMLHSFWGDQLALAAMLGRQRPNTTVNLDGCRVKLFDAARIFFNMKSKDQTPPDGVYATHYKGRRKDEA